MAAAPILTILRNGETVKTCPLEGEAVLGRGEGCVIRLEDRAISRQHALFRVVDGAVQVEKKSEFAPLMVNGADTTKAVVREADVISIGPYLLRVSVPKAQPSASAAPSAPAAPQASLAPTLAMASTGSGTTAPTESLAGGGDVVATGSALGEIPEQGGDAQAQGAEAGLEGAPAGEVAGGLPDLGLEQVDAGADAQVQAGDGGSLGLGLAAVAPPEEPVEQADDDAKTKLTPAAKISVHLVFASGTANVTDYELTKDEVSIGRGKNCDIVLNDKKASRKNSIIRRAGLSFSIKDLDSANGTYVNGVKVQEQELSGDDVIKIGGVEFQFKALSADYSSREKDFMPVPEEPPEEQALPVEDPGAQVPAADPNGAMDLNALMQAGGTVADPAASAGAAALPGAIPGADPNVGIPGITGIGPGDVKRMGIIDKVKNFKTLPKNEKIKVGLIVAGMLFVAYEFLNDDDEAPKKAAKTKPKPGVVATTGAQPQKGPATFATLSPEQQRFVEAQHALAFDYYKNKEYDKSLFELNKIFALINDYKDSRDIERYAREGKRKLEAFEEEKRRKEEEAQLKAKIQALVDECKERMDKKQYDQAKELFTQISLLDPDNVLVAGWKKEIEKYEEDKRAAEQTKLVQEEINKRAWEVFNEGMGLKKQGKYHSAIDVFLKVGDIGASDPKPVEAAKKQIQACKNAIRAAREPILAQAKAAEDAQDYPKAFALYRKATKVDPPHPAGYAGMARIRSVLHDRAKIVYTEAIMAESFSDFDNAKKKFKECLDIAPVDDIYHERATRKLARYFKKEQGAPQ